MAWTAQSCDALRNWPAPENVDHATDRLPRTRRHLSLEYPGGLQLSLNDHPTEEWRIRAGAEEITVPPAG
jgi:hypothetical protein